MYPPAGRVPSSFFTLGPTFDTFPLFFPYCCRNFLGPARPFGKLVHRPPLFFRGHDPRGFGWLLMDWKRWLRWNARQPGNAYRYVQTLTLLSARTNLTEAQL